MEYITRFRRQLMEFLKRDWPIFVIMAVLLFAGIWLGERLPQANPKLADFIENQAMRKLSSMAKWLNNMPFYIWILVIWLNNLYAATGSFISGIFLLPPAMVVLFNGVVIGLVQKISETRGISRSNFYLSLVPHGIFELAAFFIAAGLGIRFGLIFWRSLWRLLIGKDNNGLYRNFFNEMKYYSVLILVLLSIAAIIEVTVSPLLLSK